MNFLAVRVVLVGVPFIWLGAVLAISFLETPLKFRAPDITIPLGLGIGRLVFRALNVAELIFAALITGALMVRPFPPTSCGDTDGRGVGDANDSGRRIEAPARPARETAAGRRDAASLASASRLHRVGDREGRRAGRVGVPTRR